MHASFLPMTYVERNIHYDLIIYIQVLPLSGYENKQNESSVVKNEFFIEYIGLECIQNDLVPCVKQINNMTQQIWP